MIDGQYVRNNMSEAELLTQEGARAIEYLEGEVPVGIILDGENVDGDEEPFGLSMAVVIAVILAVIAAVAFVGWLLWPEDEPVYASPNQDGTYFPEAPYQSPDERRAAMVSNAAAMVRNAMAYPVPSEYAKRWTVNRPTQTNVVGNFGARNPEGSCTMQPGGRILELGPYDNDLDGYSDSYVVKYEAPTGKDGAGDCKTGTVVVVMEE